MNSCRCEKNWEPTGLACHKKCAICTCQWYIYGNKQGKHNLVWRSQLAVRLTVSVLIGIIFPVWFRSKTEVLSGLKIADKQYLHGPIFLALYIPQSSSCRELFASVSLWVHTIEKMHRASKGIDDWYSVLDCLPLTIQLMRFCICQVVKEAKLRRTNLILESHMKSSQRVLENYLR